MLKQGLFLVVLVLTLAILPVRADDVTFVDTTETLSVSTSSTRIIPLSGATFCDNVSEVCSAEILSPSGPFCTIMPSGTVNIGESSGNISDSLTFQTFGACPLNTFVDLVFRSDSPNNSLGTTCSATAFGPCLIENGNVQPAGGVTWINFETGAVITDNVSFQSDVETPEPASMVLLATGLLGAALRRKFLA